MGNRDYIGKTIYKFKLMENLPPRFIKNENHPELPVITNYLRQFESKKYRKGEFEEILEGFLGCYKIDKATGQLDKKIKKKLFLHVIGISSLYAVCCFNDRYSKMYEFGYLTKVKLTKSQCQASVRAA